MPDMDRSHPHRFAMIGLLAAAAWTSSCAEPRSRTAPAPIPAPRRARPDPAEPSDVVDRVVEAHNLERAHRKLPPLSVSPELKDAAMAHAGDMADRRKMAHKGGDGSSPFDRMKRSGYAFRAAGENVAYGFDDVEAVMDGWMRSAGHKRNILGKFTEIGVGRAIARDGASYWCVTFGTPDGR
jgi:uncharacterized protein YkwD